MSRSDQLRTPSGGDAAELAQFGYTQSMERRTGRFASFAVAFAFVSIATGIFTTYGAVLNSPARWGFGPGRSQCSDSWPWRSCWAHWPRGFR